jgi:hypothetical protein
MLNKNKKYYILVNRYNIVRVLGFLISIDAKWSSDKEINNIDDLTPHMYNEFYAYLDYNEWNRYKTIGWKLSWDNTYVKLQDCYENININNYLRNEKLNNIL